jgi:hypothetical protein
MLRLPLSLSVTAHLQLIRWLKSGTLVTVYKNGVAVISSQDIFATANYKYLAIDTCGLLIAKGGSPATAANFKNYVVRQAA